MSWERYGLAALGGGVRGAIAGFQTHITNLNNVRVQELRNANLMEMQRIRLEQEASQGEMNRNLRISEGEKNRQSDLFRMQWEKQWDLDHAPDQNRADSLQTLRDKLANINTVINAKHGEVSEEARKEAWQLKPVVEEQLAAVTGLPYTYGAQHGDMSDGFHFAREPEKPGQITQREEMVERVMSGRIAEVNRKIEEMRKPGSGATPAQISAQEDIRNAFYEVLAQIDPRLNPNTGSSGTGGARHPEIGPDGKPKRKDGKYVAEEGGGAGEGGGTPGSRQSFTEMALADNEALKGGGIPTVLADTVQDQRGYDPVLGGGGGIGTGGNPFPGSYPGTLDPNEAAAQHAAANSLAGAADTTGTGVTGGTVPPSIPGVVGQTHTPSPAAPQPTFSAPPGTNEAPAALSGAVEGYRKVPEGYYEHSPVQGPPRALADSGGGVDYAALREQNVEDRTLTPEMMLDTHSTLRKAKSLVEIVTNTADGTFGKFAGDTFEGAARLAIEPIRKFSEAATALVKAAGIEYDTEAEAAELAVKIASGEIQPRKQITGKQLSDFFSMVVDAHAKALKSMPGKTWEAVKTIPGKTGEAIGNVGNSIWDFGGKVLNYGKEKIKEGFNSFGNDVPDLGTHQESLTQPPYNQTSSPSNFSQFLNLVGFDSTNYKEVLPHIDGPTDTVTWPSFRFTRDKGKGRPEYLKIGNTMYTKAWATHYPGLFRWDAANKKLIPLGTQGKVENVKGVKDFESLATKLIIADEDYLLEEKNDVGDGEKIIGPGLKVSEIPEDVYKKIKSDQTKDVEKRMLIDQQVAIAIKKRIDWVKGHLGEDKWKGMSELRKAYWVNLAWQVGQNSAAAFDNLKESSMLKLWGTASMDFLDSNLHRKPDESKEPEDEKEKNRRKIWKGLALRAERAAFAIATDRMHPETIKRLRHYGWYEQKKKHSTNRQLTEQRMPTAV